MNHLANVVQVFTQTGTLWENYAPDSAAPGKPAKADFVGWSGIGPIVFLIEHAIGIRADAPANTITWTLRSQARVGVERLWFGGRTVSLVAEPPDEKGARLVRVQADRPFHLIINWKTNRTERTIESAALSTFTVSP